MQIAIDDKRLRECRILVVDDVELNRKLLAHCLQSQGYRDIVTASDGAHALEMTREHKPDLVILDLMMPGMDGFSYCEAIRQDNTTTPCPS